MNRRARFRTTVFLLIIALVMGIFSFRLYKVQSTVDEVALQQADSVTYYTTVEASPGADSGPERNGTDHQPGQLRHCHHQLRLAQRAKSQRIPYGPAGALR